MTKFVSKNKCSMKGIIDYEIAKFRKQNVFYIPILFANGRFLATVDEGAFNNYKKVAITTKEYTIKYLIEQGIPLNKIEILETNRLVIRNYGSTSPGAVSSVTKAFVIKIK